MAKPKLSPALTLGIFIVGLFALIGGVENLIESGRKKCLEHPGVSMVGTVGNALDLMCKAL